MKKFITVILFLNLVLIPNLLAQDWLPAGTVPNPGVRPSISVVNKDVVWIAGGSIDSPRVFRTINSGATWSSVPVSGINRELYCIWAFDANTAIVGEGGVNGNARLFRTDNAGAFWECVAQTGPTGGYFNGIAFPKTDNERNFGLALAEGVFRSTNSGLTWSMLNSGVNGVSNAHNSLFIIDDYLYGYGLNYGVSGVRMTYNNGSTWFNQSINLNGNYTCAAAFSDVDLKGLSATSTSMPFISRSIDGGFTWTQFDIGSGVSGEVRIKWIPYTHCCYIMGANGGIKRSPDGGLTWATMTTTGVQDLYNFDFAPQNNIIYGYAVSRNGSIIKVEDAGILTGVSSKGNTPRSYSLSQNYPNPFNPATSIQYEIPGPAFVKLSVYDILGREVQVLVNEFKMAGSHVAAWDASDFSSGIYFCNLTAGRFRATKKMVFSK